MLAPVLFSFCGLLSLQAMGAIFGSTPTNPAFPPAPFCESSKEFITTYEYLRSSPRYFRTGDQSLATSKAVADGCNGAANRFIKVTRFFSKTELGVDQILNLGKEAALRTDSATEAFIKLYTQFFARDGLDLDINTALQMARKMSIDFQGDINIESKDFEKISEYCNKKPGLNLGRLHCAQLAQKIALLNEKHNLPMGDKFISLMNYLTNGKGPQMTPTEAEKLSEELMQIHPEAGQNFRTGYEYALSEKGLAAKRDDAFRFAKLMARKTSPSAKEDSKESLKTTK